MTRVPGCVTTVAEMGSETHPAKMVTVANAAALKTLRMAASWGDGELGQNVDSSLHY